MPIFKEAGKNNPRNKNFQIWQQDNHPEEVYSPKFTLSKIRYIHNNPVEEGFVWRPEDYYYSSAGDYAGGKSPVKVSLIELHSLFYIWKVVVRAKKVYSFNKIYDARLDYSQQRLKL